MVLSYLLKYFEFGFKCLRLVNKVLIIEFNIG